jgi:hypothetical protein
MPAVLLMKNDQGRLEGFGERGSKTYNKFLAACKALEIGEMLSFSYTVPRSPKFHKLHFVMLRAFFDAQEQFESDYVFRKWSEVGAGHCKYAPGAHGRMVAIPLSIAYDALDDVEFSELHAQVKDFFRSEHARRFLWPHLTEQATWETVETVLAEFEAGRG